MRATAQSQRPQNRLSLETPPHHRQLTNIIENYAQIVESKDEKTGRKKRTQIWPRYHQLHVVRSLLAHAALHGPGKRYLIQHSAGSGKSNSIAWLAHQLVGLEKDDTPLFDSVIVITDRRILDQQIRDTIKQFAQVGSIVGAVRVRRQFQNKSTDGISALRKNHHYHGADLPFVLDAIGSEHRGKSYAVVIDEAHSSQGGRTAAAVSAALGGETAEDEEETLEDQINRIMESKKLLNNASYFAFTATPKNKTLELLASRSRSRTAKSAIALSTAIR
ncbi:MAG: DEAD/DEAH box helicase family protein [Caldilineaceae bacterium]